MGVDSYVLLRTRDGEALREALATLAPTRVRRLADGSVSIFTGHRYDDADADFTIRCWLEAQFGPALTSIHDDPRGVLVVPDFTASRAKSYASYEEMVAALSGAGRFIDPSPPTEEERAQREKAITDLIEGVRQQTVPPPSGTVSEPPLEGFSSVLSRLVGRDMSGDLAAVSRGRLSTSPPPMEPDE